MRRWHAARMKNGDLGMSELSVAAGVERGDSKSHIIDRPPLAICSFDVSPRDLEAIENVLEISVELHALCHNKVEETEDLRKNLKETLLGMAYNMAARRADLDEIEATIVEFEEELLQLELEQQKQV